MLSIQDAYALDCTAKKKMLTFWVDSFLFIIILIITARVNARELLRHWIKQISQKSVLTHSISTVNCAGDCSTFSSTSRNASIALLFSCFNICIHWICMTNPNYHHYTARSISAHMRQKLMHTISNSKFDFQGSTYKLKVKQQKEFKKCHNEYHYRKRRKL